MKRLRLFLLMMLLAGAVACLLLTGSIGERLSEQIDERYHLSEIRAAAMRSHIDPNLVYAVIFVESRFKREAQSRKGAQGLMQVMPATGEEILRKYEMDGLGVDLSEPATNLTVGTLFLGELIEEFGDTQIALAAYNGGPNAVRRWLESTDSADIGKFPKQETRLYVESVIESYNRLKRLEGLWRSLPDWVK